ncbi:MAG: hypothetical protein M1830_001440 [Pleopsidium flavum]|nr:MAG: hypothetical protein M1830_001440 [Pleopsidium flavum]
MAEETSAGSSPIPQPPDHLSVLPPATKDESNPTDAMDEPSEEADRGEILQVEDTAADTNTNGDVEPTIATTESVPAETVGGNEDTEIKDNEDLAGHAVSGSDPPAGEANGTPASSRKSNGSTKKKTTSVPEHKTKKLNKKKSKVMTHLDAQPGEYYFARLKGYPPWPSIICDEEMLPQILLSTRPVTTKQQDGTYKEAYADGGKRAYERTFPIMFLYTNEFQWMPNTDLTALGPQACKDFPEKGKTKSLIAAYEIAGEQHDLAYFKEMLADHQRAMQEDSELRAQREAKKQKKGKRKSTDAPEDGEDIDMDDVEGMEAEDAGGDSKPKSKKRKKSLDSDGEAEKPSKTPKTATKLKLSTPKTPSADTTSKKKTGSSTKAAKPKGSTKKSAAKANGSDEENVDTPKVEEKPLTPQEAKQKKEKEVLYLRHKLQKGFLSRDTMPKEEEMKSMSEFISKLETYADLEVSIIRTTKINKVLKAIIKLSSIPKDEEFNFKKRSHELLAKWNKILADDPSAGPSGDKEEAATTNGIAKDEKPDGDDNEKSELPATKEEAEKPAEGHKIGTTVEGAEEGEPSAAPEATTSEIKTDEPDIVNAPEKAYEPPNETLEATA